MPTAWEREQERQRKERYLADREAETGGRNEVIRRRLADLDGILTSGVEHSVVLDYNARKLPLPVLDVGGLDQASVEPTLEGFLPRQPGAPARLIPGWKGRHERRRLRAEDEFRSAHMNWQEDEKKRRRRLAARKNGHELAVAKAQEQHLRMDELAADARTGKQAAVEDYVRYALESSTYPHGFPVKFQLRYLPSRNNLLIECEFPVARDIIPAESGWKYVKTRDAIESKARSAADTDKIYKAILAQVTLRTIYEIFTVDAFCHIQTVSFKGVVNDDDPSTGRPIQPLLVSLRAEREEFLDRDFSRLDPVKALQRLRANFSPAPTQLLPVAAIVEFDVNDPRFIEEQDIISGLNEDANLIDLTAGAFRAVDYEFV